MKHHQDEILEYISGYSKGIEMFSKTTIYSGYINPPLSLNPHFSAFLKVTCLSLQ